MYPEENSYIFFGIYFFSDKELLFLGFLAGKPYTKHQKEIVLIVLRKENVWREKMKVFHKAEGVFVPGKSQVPNVFAGFRCDFPYHTGKVEFVIAAHTYYRIYINGEFLGVGPASAPFGHLTAERYDLTGKLEEKNHIAVEVIGYVPEENNYATHESSVFFGEIRAEKEVISATGDKNWTCGVLTCRDFSTETISFGRRCPLESYELDEHTDAWKMGEVPKKQYCEVVAKEGEALWKDGGEKEIKEGVRFIQERDTQMPDIKEIRGMRVNGVSSMEYVGYEGNEKDWWESDRFLSRAGDKEIKRLSNKWGGYQDRVFVGKLEEQEELCGKHIYILDGCGKPAALEFALEKPETGFIGLSFETNGKAVIDITWNDYLDEKGQIPVKADNTNRIIHLETNGGVVSWESIEPHYMKYIKIIMEGKGEIRLLDLYVRRYRFPDKNTATFLCSDKTLNRIYEAAKQTLLTNSLAYFFDSPERERGGWAGDSYWTGRAAAMLLSDTSLERAMLYGFLAADYSPMMKGSFPSCCCGGGKQDPCMMYTWNLFVLLELTDYYQRTNDKQIKEDFRHRVELFMKESQTMKNEAGVLENIPGSLFVDWSTSNEIENTHPISTVANALYAMVAERLGGMYENETYKREALEIRETLRNVYEKGKKRKFDLFTMYPYLADSLIMENGELKEKQVYSEAAQYYYFWTGLLDVEDARDLWKTLLEEWGPAPTRFRGTAHLKVGSCGIFFGYMIRFELLSRYGEVQLLEKEMKRLCGYMMDQEPGTFWETLSGTDSRNHGFGSHFGVVLVRDFLGIGIPDRSRKILDFHPQLGDLKWAKGTVKIEDGIVSVSWYRTANGMRAYLSAPKGYCINMEVPKEYRYCQKICVNGKERSGAENICVGNVLDMQIM